MAAIVEIFEYLQFRYAYQRADTTLCKATVIRIADKTALMVMRKEGLLCRPLRRRKSRSCKGQVGGPFPNLQVCDLKAKDPMTSLVANVIESEVGRASRCLSPVVVLCNDGFVIYSISGP